MIAITDARLTRSLNVPDVPDVALPPEITELHLLEPAVELVVAFNVRAYEPFHLVIWQAGPGGRRLVGLTARRVGGLGAMSTVVRCHFPQSGDYEIRIVEERLATIRLPLRIVFAPNED